uniref:Uncharacterized protein n=2 Tax=Candidatus Berkiella cookevillensis TaxID=437022 RepID=A0A0Q9YEK1_9GAMM
MIMLNFFTAKKEEEKKNPFTDALNEIVDRAFEASHPEYEAGSEDELNTEEMDFEMSYEAISDDEVNGLAEDAKMEEEELRSKFGPGK